MAGNDDTIQSQFYAPFPNLGVKLSQQWEAIRTDTAALFPIVRGVGLDADGDFSTLNGLEKCVVQAFEIGRQGFHNKYRIHYSKEDDTLELAYNDGTEAVPHFYTTWSINPDGHVLQQNTPTTASNKGTGEGVFFQKTGVDLEFKSLKVTAPLSISSTNNDITIASSAEANTASTLGGDVGLTSTKVGVDLPFKGLTAGVSTVLTDNGDHIRIDSIAQVVEFYGISVGPSSGTPSYIEVHNMLFNREDFYITQQKTNPSNKTVIINSISDPFNSTDYVAVIGDNMTGQLAMHDGTAGEPAIGFTNETDTGIRRRAANDMALVVSGSDKLRLQDSLILASVPVEVTSGAAVGTPDFAFFPDTDTGLYQIASGDSSIAFSTGGVYAGHFDSSQLLTLASIINAANGAVGAPTYSFSGQTNSGIFKANDTAALHSVDIAANGVQAGSFQWATGAVMKFVAPGVIQAGLGSATLPAYTFTGVTNTGMYSNATSGDGIAFATDGDNDQLILRGDGISLFGGRLILSAGGTEPAPALNIVDGNSGLYRPISDVLGVTGQLLCENGSAALPGITFINTLSGGTYKGGIYSASASSMVFSFAGVNHIQFQTAGIFSPVAVYFNYTGNVASYGGTHGTVSLPAYSFFPDTNSGIYQIASEDDGVAFATGGVAAGNFVYNAGSPYLNIPGEVRVADEAYGAGWDSDLSVPTKNALYDKIEAVSAIAAGGFYLTVKHHDDSFVQHNVNVIGVNANHFYLSGNGDEVTINSRDVWVDKSGDTMTGNLTIATGGSDSIFEFFDSGSLAYTMGWDDSAGAFKLADGAFDGTNDRIIVNPATVYVKDHLSVDKIEGGYAQFYSHVEMGNPGNETSGFNVNGVLRHGVLRISDMEFLEHEFMVHLHRHSTTNPPVIISSLSNTDTYAHAAPDPGDTIFSLVSTAWGTTNYEVGSRINFLVDTNGGTPADNNMPGRIDFRTTAPGQTGLFGTLAMSIRSDQTIEATSHFYVAGNVIADRVYADQGNFYTRLILNDRPMKFASDGILYAWDPVRLKYLSVSRHTFQYGREMGGGASAFLIGPAGTIVDSATGTSHGLIRNATITSIDAWATTVAVAPMDLDIRQMLQGGGATHSSIHIITLETGTRVYTGEDGLDFDVDAGKGIYVVMAPSGGSTLSDPVVHVEVAWRLD